MPQEPMSWKERRAILHGLMQRPANKFRHSTSSSVGAPDKTVETFAAADHPCGRVEVVFAKNRASLLVRHERISGATKLYRRLKGVTEKDPSFALAEAELVPLYKWRAVEKSNHWEFHNFNVYYGEFFLRALDSTGEDAYLYAGNQRIGRASRLYRKLVASFRRLRDELSRGQLETWCRSGRWSILLLPSPSRR